MLKSFSNFTHDLNKLTSFYKATLYAYEQTELTLAYKKRKKIAFNLDNKEEIKILPPTNFKAGKRVAKVEIRKNLNEVTFVRIISALEVFLVDLIRDVFILTKEPFKRNDLKLELNHAELLSISSTAEIYSKIINKECRKLTSSGYEEIAKYFRRHFDIENK